jgi:hypothetical protein
MPIYDPETGELKGYRFKLEPEPMPRPHLFSVGTHIVFPKFTSESLRIAVSVA